MAVYERSIRVAAPLDRVWGFHADPAGLPAVMPDWLGLRVESVRGPDGDPDPERLSAGTTMVSSVRPFGVGPRQRWTSEIVAARATDERALLRDRMTEGPFDRWEHTHLFVADGDLAGGDGDLASDDEGGDRATTTIVDRVEYALPGGPVGRLADPFARVGLAPTFRYRHRRTAELLERAVPTE